MNASKENAASAYAYLNGEGLHTRDGRVSYDIEQLRALVFPFLAECMHTLPSEENIEQFKRISGEQVRLVVCSCPADCEIHGRIDQAEARQGRRTRK